MKLITILLLITVSHGLHAQPNLAPNPSFEEFDSCMITCFACHDSLDPCFVGLDTNGQFNILDAIDYCKNWFDPTGGTSDYWNYLIDSVTGFQNLNGTPTNIFGTQVPKSGIAYCGFGVNFGVSMPWYYEYLSAKLNATMTFNKRYCVSFHASPSEKNGIYLNSIGAAFTSDSLGFPYPCSSCANFLNIPAQIINDSLNQITDTTTWTEINGSFVSDGSEKYIILGCFTDHNESDTIFASGIIEQSWRYNAYTYIDDVSVTELKALHSRDTIICANTVFPITLKAYPGFDFYIWSTGDTTRSISINGPGDYYITAASWCGVITDTLTVAYFDSSQYNQYLGADLNLCPDQFPYLYHTSPMGLSNYQWSTSDTAQNIFLTQAGQYVLTANSQCHTLIDTIIVNELSAPVLQLGNDTILCNNQSISLQAITAQSYLWNTNDTTQNIMVNQTGNYFVNITYNNGCNATDTIVITAYNPNNYTLNLGNDTAYCQTDFPIQLQTNNLIFDTYLWNTGSISNTTTATSAGNYFLIANYICGAVADTITLSLAPSPTVNLGNDTTLCIGQQITLNAGNHTSYLWNNQSTAPTITVNENGNYGVTVTNTFNCIASDNIQVNFIQETAQLLPNDTALYASAFPYSISLSNQYQNYQSNQFTIYNSQFTIQEAGIYFLSAIDNNGCLLSDSINIKLKTFELIVPTIISKNQNFIINNLPTNSSLKIFDAIGQLVYQNYNYQNNFMPLVANAVYFVELEYVISNKTEKYKGKLLVVD